MSRRRVVVTGLGCVSPVGNTVNEAWANLLAGRSGIDRITKFDASAFACQMAGEVKGFDLESYIGAKEARSMDTFIHYGIAAAHQAVVDAGLPMGDALDEEAAHRIGAHGLEAARRNGGRCLRGHCRRARRCRGRWRAHRH